MQKILLLFICTVCHNLLYAQNIEQQTDSIIESYKEEVKGIDGQILYRTLLDYKGYRLGGENDITEALFALYFSPDGILKKSKYIYSEEDVSCVIYYGKDGEAFFTSFFAESDMNGSYSISRFLDKNRKLVYIDHILRDGSTYGSIVEHIIRKSWADLPIPQVEDMFYDNVVDIESFNSCVKNFIEESGYKFDRIRKPINTIPVKFVSPEKGDTTFIKQNGVNVYEKPSFNSSTVEVLNIRPDVFIVSVEGDWYRIKLLNDYHNLFKGGYIHKDVLTLVEHEIK